MGFLDKVKTQASQVAQKAQEGVKTGQDKLAEAQAKKRADALLHDLGAAVYLERTDRATAQTAAEIERVLAELHAHEAQHGPIDTTATAASPPGPGEAQVTGDYSTETVADTASAVPAPSVTEPAPPAPAAGPPPVSPRPEPAPAQEGNFKLDDL